MSRPIIFLGSSLNILQYTDVCDLNGVEVAGIIDDDYYGNRADIDGIPVISGESVADFETLKQSCDFFIGTNKIIGQPRSIDRRNKYIKLCNDLELPLANIIDPTARISSRVKLGQGIFVGFCSYVGAHVELKDHCRIHGHVAVGHHSIIEANVVMQRKSFISGSIHLKQDAYIGIGSEIIASTKEVNGMTVGEHAVIAPGLIVMRSVEDNEIVTHASRKIYQARTVTD